MSFAPTLDDPSLRIPAPPRRITLRLPRWKARLLRLPRWDVRGALREASVAGFLTLAASWALAELAFVLLG
jgi:hypothetical protein